NDTDVSPPRLSSSLLLDSSGTTVSTGRTFPTGVGAPILLDGPQDEREGTTPPSILLIHRFQALLLREVEPGEIQHWWGTAVIPPRTGFAAGGPVVRRRGFAVKVPQPTSGALAQPMLPGHAVSASNSS